MQEAEGHRAFSPCCNRTCCVLGPACGFIGCCGWSCMQALSNGRQRGWRCCLAETSAGTYSATIPQQLATPGALVRWYVEVGGWDGEASD